MKDMFKDAKPGDRVYDILVGWGEVSSVGSYLMVKFPQCSFGEVAYVLDGRAHPADLIPRLYWDEVAAPEPPSKPLPDIAVDTPILVADDGQGDYKAHFHSHSPEGGVYTYAFGRTSFSTQKDRLGQPIVTYWPYWRLPEENANE